jgi:hypothetical protein
MSKMEVTRNGILDRDLFLIFILELLIKKPMFLSEEWVLAIGQPRYPGSPGPEALRPTLSGGVPFSSGSKFCSFCAKVVEKG